MRRRARRAATASRTAPRSRATSSARAARWPRRTGRRSCPQPASCTQLKTCSTAPTTSERRSATSANAPNWRAIDDRSDAQRAGRQQSLHSAPVERSDPHGAGALVLDEQQAGDQVARQGEEHRHTEVAGRHERQPGVEQQHQHHRHGTDAVQCGLMWELLAHGAGTRVARRDGTAIRTGEEHHRRSPTSSPEGMAEVMNVRHPAAGHTAWNSIWAEWRRRARTPPRTGVERQT